jgi:hypothetical protein
MKVVRCLCAFRATSSESIYGAISATNLSGNNTGDQTLANLEQHL